MDLVVSPWRVIKWKQNQHISWPVTSWYLARGLPQQAWSYICAYNASPFSLCVSTRARQCLTALELMTTPSQGLSFETESSELRPHLFNPQAQQIKCSFKGATQRHSQITKTPFPCQVPKQVFYINTRYIIPETDRK